MPNGWWWQGRDEIERQHSIAHQTVFKTTEAVISPKKIRMLKPDVADCPNKLDVVTGMIRSKDPRDYVMTYVLSKRGLSGSSSLRQNRLPRTARPVLIL